MVGETQNSLKIGYPHREFHLLKLILMVAHIKKSIILPNFGHMEYNLSSASFFGFFSYFFFLELLFDNFSIVFAKCSVASVFEIVELL